MPRKPGSSSFTAQAPLSPKQHALLERTAERLDVPFAEVLRRALERYAEALDRLTEVERYLETLGVLDELDLLAAEGDDDKSDAA